ncbi:MAG: VanZ family protein [Lachnospiraceae bacterium]|nr:VanZ family protein [Lachnospiraceae bacterium]
MKKWIVRGVLTAAVIAWMAVIYSFSAENGEESSHTSEAVVDAVITAAESIHLVNEGGVSESDRERMTFVVRKTAHATEYAILAVLFAVCLLSWGVQKAWLLAALSWVCATVYAVTDEYHQRSVAGRAGQWSDVCVDAFGAAIGIGIVLLVLVRRRRKAARNA